MQTVVPKIPTTPSGVHVSNLEAAFIRELNARSQGRKTPPFVPYGHQALLATQVRDKGLVTLQFTGTGARVLMTPKGTALLQYLDAAQGVA